MTGTATALTTIDNGDTAARDSELQALFDEWEPDVIVIGVPYNMDGSDSTMTTAAIDFADLLAERFTLPVARIDERLTSAEAVDILREQRQSGQRRRKIRPGDVDSLAAQLIAQSWLREQ